MKDRVNLVNQPLPFGIVKNYNMHGGTPVDDGVKPKSLGPETVHSNHGADHAPSFASHKIPVKDVNPFAPCGEKK